MALNILLLIIGFAGLIKGADIFVDASVGIAKKLKIPSVIIGLTIVALGTSMPEAVVSVTASLKGANALAIGNVVGSNIFNLLLIVGVCALIKPFAVNIKEISKDFWISAGAAALILLMMVIGKDYISRAYSLILLLIFAAYITMLIRQALKNRAAGEDENGASDKQKPLPLNILLAVVGCSLIIIGGQLTVNGATAVAQAIGITERVIGLTVVAVGTSLPELVTSLVAGKKGENSIALGNVVGSNIFNIFFILGTAGLISPLEIDPNLIFDAAVLVGASLLTILFVYTGKKVTRLEGIAMAAVYVAYAVFICLK